MAKGPAAVVVKHFVKVTDPRVDRGGNHDLVELVFMALTAVVCGAQGWVDVERFVKCKVEWFGKYISLEHGVPSHDTFGRVFSRLDTSEFLTAMHAWVDEFAGSLRGRGIAVDGKTLRGSFDEAAGKSPLHTVTAFASDARLCLRQAFVEAGGNEITAVPTLLSLLELDGAVVTMDAMHCQVETAQAVLDRGGDYLVVVKGNQNTLHTRLLEKFIEYGESDYQVAGLRKLTTVEKSHGRRERREYMAVAADSREPVLRRWPKLGSILMATRRREVDGETSDETTFYISSLPPKVRLLSRHARSHWSIENSQHWVLDVVFDEDSSRIRKGSSPEISSSLRRLALNILRQDTSLKENLRGKRLRAGWDERVLDAILAGFSSL